jgi:hypothetical protein
LPIGRLREERNHVGCLLIYWFFEGKKKTEGKKRKKRETKSKKERTRNPRDRGKISVSTSFFKDRYFFFVKTLLEFFCLFVAFSYSTTPCTCSVGHSRTVATP